MFTFSWSPGILSWSDEGENILLLLTCKSKDRKIVGKKIIFFEKKEVQAQRWVGKSVTGNGA